MGGQFDGSLEQDSGGIVAAARDSRDGFSCRSRSSGNLDSVEALLDARFLGHDKSDGGEQLNRGVKRPYASGSNLALGARA